MKQATPQRFVALYSRFEIAEDRARIIFDDLEKRYAEEHRHYHDLSHIDRMLSWLDASGQGTDVVELAVWFHDCVYEPMAPENEAESARHFEEQFGAIVDEATTRHVVRLILSTDPRTPRTGRLDEDLLIDIDLSVLGSSPEEYEDYQVAVRKEYSMVPEKDFREARCAILRSFLSGKIYATDFFAALEEQARKNIENELTIRETPET